MTETKQLLPCPFCGETEPEMRHTKAWDYYVKCPWCGSSTRHFHENERGAASRWNGRAMGKCATCAHLSYGDGFTWCAHVHQKRGLEDFCSKWTEKSWV